jgi:ATP-dependent Lhr-like helicase
VCQQLLSRHGVLTREAVAGEGIMGGFGAIYPVLKALEETGRIRRGYFVAGLGATQFAIPGALDLLRSPRPRPGDSVADLAINLPAGAVVPVVLDATDPANPYGATLPWPARGTDAGRGPTRSVGATTFIVDGALTAYLARGDRQFLTWLPEAEPERSRAALAVGHALMARTRTGDDEPRGAAGTLIEEIDGRPPSDHPITPYLIQAGFVGGALGLHAPTARQPATAHAARDPGHGLSGPEAAARESVARSARRGSPLSSPFGFLKHERPSDARDD